jgi:hypothetical protein
MHGNAAMRPRRGPNDTDSVLKRAGGAEGPARASLVFFLGRHAQGDLVAERQGVKLKGEALAVFVHPGGA